MPQEMPKYAAGSLEDDIRTGREVHFGNNKKSPWDTLPFILLGIIGVIVLLSPNKIIQPKNPETPQVNETVISPNAIKATISEEETVIKNDYVTAAVTIHNESRQVIYEPTANCTITNPEGETLGQASGIVAAHLAPGEQASANITIPIKYTIGQLTITVSPSYDKP